VGRIGSSRDNAVAESFWASLKRKLISRYRFASRADARGAIIGWTNNRDSLYNTVRLHSSLGNVPPNRVGTTLRTPRPSGQGPGVHRGLENRLQLEPSKRCARLAQPQRVRLSMGRPTPTPTHIAAGPTIWISTGR
jgi:Integrase core domain